MYEYSNFDAAYVQMNAFSYILQYHRYHAPFPRMPDPKHCRACRHAPPHHILAGPMYLGSSNDTGAFPLPNLSDPSIEWNGRSCPKFGEGFA